MAENEVVRTIRVRGVPEGLENLTSQLQRAEQAYAGVGTAAAASGNATETSARKLNTTERQYRALSERLDSTARVYRQLQQDTRTLSGAFDAGFMGKGAEAAARFNTELLQIRQNIQDVGGKLATGSAGLDKMFGIGASAGKSARDSASAFEAELKALDDIAAERARGAAQAFWSAFDQQFAGAGSSARLSATAFSGLLDELEEGERIAGMKAKAASDEYWRTFNTQFAGGGKSASASASVFQEVFAAQEQQAQTLQKLRQQYDPLGVAQERYAKAIDDTNKLLATGVITEGQHLTITTNAHKVLEDTTKAYNGAFTAQGKYTNGTGLARHELINLSRQLQDVGVSLASGQSPLTVLIQQGTQIADVFAASRASMAGFFAQAARGVAGFAMSGAGLLTGGAIVSGAAIAAGMQYADAQREVERAMAGVGRQSGITVGQINRLSASYAEAAKVSVGTAREMITAFASTGKIDASLLPGTASLSKNFAAQMGVSAAEAAKTLAGAFVDPTKGAQDLNKEIGFLDAKTLEYIRTAQAQGRLGEAQKVMADALGQSIAGAADRTSGLARAWNAVWNAASGAWDAIGKATGGQNTLEDRLAKLIEAERQARSRRSRTALTDYGDGISDLQEQIRRQNQQRDRDTRTARERAASLPALAILDEINPFGAEIRKLDTMASTLKKSLEEAASALNPDQARAVAEAYDRIVKARQQALTPAQQERALGELNVKSIDARTLAERTSVELGRLQLDSAFKLLETEQQRERINRTIMELQAQANRQAREYLRSAGDDLALAGLRPFQRQMKQMEIEARNLREQVGGSAAASDGSMAVGMRSQRGGGLLDPLAAISYFESRNRNIYQQAVPPGGGYNPSVGRVTGPSTAQGIYQITNSTWQEFAKAAGVDLRMYPNALSAPADVQQQMAATIYKQEGFSRWAPYNADLRRYISSKGGESAFGLGGTADSSISAGMLTKQNAALKDFSENTLRTANDNLKEQEQELARVAESYGKTAGQITQAQKQQELFNQFTQAGAPISAETAKEIDRLAAAYGRVADGMARVKLMNDLRFERDQLGRTSEEQSVASKLRSSGLPVDLDSAEASAIRMNMQLSETKDLLGSAAKGFIADLRSGKTAAEALSNVLDQILTKLANKAIDGLISGMFGGSGGFNLFSSLGLGNGSSFGGSSSGSYSLGAGGYSGMGPFFASGGFTGAGGKYDPAGIVHRGEYVFSAASVNRIGLGNLDAMHRQSLPGYAAGGYVATAPYIHPAANANARPEMKVVVNNNHSSAQVETQQHDDGSFEIRVVDAIEGRMAGRVAQGRGSLATAMGARTSGKALRG